jgi:hypothetical protein
MYALASTSDIARPICHFKGCIGHGDHAMHISHTIPTSFGQRQLPPRPMVRVHLTHRELPALIRQLSRDAEQAQADGRFGEADSLAVRVAILRDTGR